MANKNKLLQMWNATTPDEKKLIAEQSVTTPAYLYQLTQPKTRRKLNIVTAVAIDESTRRLNIKTKGRVPHVTVFDLAAMYAA